MKRYLKLSAFPVTIFLLNFYVCRELFSLEYSHFGGSIEGAYVSISRYAMENWRDLSWMPLWYCGIPYQNTYPPLLHWLVAAASALFRLSPALSYHAVTAFLYCLGPVAVYWLAIRFSGSRAYSFWAGLAYSLISPSAFLIQHVRVDLGSALHARRLQTLTFYGDGPHVSALSLLPIALLCLDTAVKKRTPLYYLLAAISMAGVVLTNWLGAVALAAAVVSYLLAKTPGTAQSSARGVWLTVFGIGVLAYLLASPWIPPSTIKVIAFNAQTTGADYTQVYKSVPTYIGLGIIAVLLLKYLTYRWNLPQFLQFCLFFSFFMSSVTLAAEWGNIFVVPQPHRYHLEMELALCLTGVFVLRLLLDRAPRWSKVAIACVLLLLAGSQVHRYRRFARHLIQPINMHARTEYKTAMWFDRHMNGRRVMVPGTSSYWLNAFTNIPQLAGGFEQGTPNWQNRVALYVIYSGENAGEKDGEIAVLWLKAFGVHAVAVGGPHSGEHYKPFRNPKKFEGLLEVAWRDGDDVIYRVPHRSNSLAHIASPHEIVGRSPINGLDVDPIRPYVAALEDPTRPLASFHWHSRDSARIIADLDPKQLLSVQMTYHPGWQATVNGSPRRIFSDGLGLLVVAPRCHGECTVELTYDGGLEMRVASWISWLSFAGCFSWIVLQGWRERTRRTCVKT